ncbi:MAG: hypothetical protein RR645_03225, partial [Clostridium sp.]
IYCENYLRAEENIEKGLLYAEKYNIEVMIGTFNYQKSNLAYLRGEFPKAEKYALNALIIFLKVSNHIMVTNTYILLGEIAISSEQYSLAINYLKESEKNYNTWDIDEKIIRIKIYYSMAQCFSKLKDHTKAIDYALMVEKEVKELEDYKIYANTLMIMALAYAEKEEKEKALICATKARKLCNKNNDIIRLAIIEEGIGEFLISALNMEDGLAHLNRALSLKLSVKGENIDRTMLKIIEGLTKCSKTHKALREIENLEENNEISNITRIKIFESRYRIYQDQNEFSKAEEQILKLISFLEVIDEKEKLIYYYMLIANFYQEINEEKLALRYFKKAFKLKQEQYEI